MRRCSKAPAALFFAFVLTAGGRALASPIEVTIDTSLLFGTSANLALDLTDGGPPANSVMISGFASDGTLGTATVTHDLTTDPATDLTSTFTLSDSGFFNEYLQQITLGTTLTFTFDTTGNLASPPDTFAFFLLDGSANVSLVSTTEPLGSNALFTFAIGADPPLEVFSSEDVGIAAREVPVGVPEPSAFVLVSLGLLASGLVRAYKH